MSAVSQLEIPDAASQGADMSIVQIPLPTELARQLERMGADEIAQAIEIYSSRKRLLDDGRVKGRAALVRGAMDRRAFILQAAKDAKVEYPYLTEAGVISEVDQRLRARGSKYRIGRDRYPKPAYIYAALEKAGFFPLKSSS